MIELPTVYPHQEVHKDRLRASIIQKGRVIMQAEPGVGKTRIAKLILGSALNRETRDNQSGKLLFAVHRRGLVDNASGSFEEIPALSFGVIMSGRNTAYRWRESYDFSDAQK